MAQYQQYTQSSSHVVVSTSGSDINPVYMCCCPPCAIAEVEGCSAMVCVSHPLLPTGAEFYLLCNGSSANDKSLCQYFSPLWGGGFFFWSSPPSSPSPTRQADYSFFSFVSTFTPSHHFPLPQTIACAFGCLFWPWNGLAAIFYHPQPPGQSNVVIVHQQRQGPPMQQYPPQQYPPQQYPPAQQMYGVCKTTLFLVWLNPVQKQHKRITKEVQKLHFIFGVSHTIFAVFFFFWKQKI